MNAMHADGDPTFQTAAETGAVAARPRVVLRDGAARGWLAFGAPRRCLVARVLDEVLPLLREIEEACERDGLHAAGYVSYEAAPAFDACLAARTDGRFPYLWFGLFDPPDVLAALPPAPPDDAPETAWRTSVTPDEYRDGFDAVRRYIRDGDTYQVNYTYRMHATAASDPWSWFLRLAGAHEMPYAAYVDTGEWVLGSASPELFFRLDGDAIESRPMKGTAARGLWAADDEARGRALGASAKDRAENVMIVDMVRNDLGRVAETGSVQVPQLFAVERYPTVWQMTSTVRARTCAPLNRIFQALFPPASVTGVPKRRATELTAAPETTARRAYTGAIGYVAPGRRAQFNVAIRTLVLEREAARAEYGVGGGIVWDSDCAGELAESVVKARVLTARRSEFDLLETLRWEPRAGYALLRFHLERLAASARYFGFDFTPARVEQALAVAVAGAPAVPHRVRLLATRGGNVSCEARPIAAGAARFADIALAAAPVDREDVFLYHKTTRRQRYDQALAACPGFDDVLLYNAAGEITESTIANVAVERDGMLVTPPIACGLLAGVLRASLIADGRLAERVLRVEDVLAGEEIFLMNAVRGMHRVRVLDPRRPARPARALAPAR